MKRLKTIFFALEILLMLCFAGFYCSGYTTTSYVLLLLCGIGTMLAGLALLFGGKRK